MKPSEQNHDLDLRANESVSVRRFAPADEPRIRDICFATALYGQPMQSVIADRAWMTDALLGYHFAVEPESLWVADADGVVVGYLAGCTDARRQGQWFRQRLFWPLVGRAVRSREIVNVRSWKLGWAAIGPALGIHRRARRIAAEYPALLHINLDAAWQGRGVGKRLLDAFLAALREQRIPGVQIVTGTVAGRAFFAKHGFALVAARPIRAVLDLPPGKQCLMARKT